MVIYEVNITVDNDIKEKCYAWLATHVQEMLSIDGFVSAEMLQQTDNEAKGKTTFTVPYKVENIQTLQYYFEHHAERMRALGTTAFPPEQYVANRRVFELKETFTAKNRVVAVVNVSSE